MAKNKYSKTDLEIYKEIYKDLDENKRVFAEKLYNEAVHMEKTLTRLKEQVDIEGPVIKSINGNGFETVNEHPAQKSYNTMIKNYNATLKALDDLAPVGKKKESKLKALMADD
nr:MAG TPA: hypothetical protein [Caudoviricetes sp.]